MITITLSESTGSRKDQAKRHLLNVQHQFSKHKVIESRKKRNERKNKNTDEMKTTKAKNRSVLRRRESGCTGAEHCSHRSSVRKATEAETVSVLRMCVCFGN